MLKCDEAELELSAYLDGELSPGDRAQLDAHLVLCEKCNAILSELENARGALQGLEHRQAPTTLRARISAAVKTLPHAAPASAPTSAHKANVSEIQVQTASATGLKLVTVPVTGMTAAAPVPLRPKRMTWSGLFASCAALLLVGLMIYSVAGTLDSGSHSRERDAKASVVAVASTATPAPSKSLDRITGNPAVVAEADKAERARKPTEQLDRPAEGAELATANLKKRSAPESDKATPQTQNKFEDAFKSAEGGLAGGKVAAGETDGKAARDELRRALAQPVDETQKDFREKANRGQALDSAAVRKAMDKDLYDSKLVDAELFKKEADASQSKDKAQEVTANNKTLPPSPAPMPSAALKPGAAAKSANEFDFAKEQQVEVAKADAAPRIALPPAVSNASPATQSATTAQPGNGPAAAAPAAPATAPVVKGAAMASDPSGRGRQIDTQEPLSLGAQARLQAQATGQQSGTQVFGGAAKADSLRAKKAPTVVVLRSENVENMIDKVQAIVKARGLSAAPEVAAAPAAPDASGNGPPPNKPLPVKKPAPQTVLTINAPLTEREIVFELFSLQDPKTNVDALVQRGTAQAEAAAKKIAVPFEKPAPAVQTLGTDKGDERYTIRIEIYAK